LIPILDKTTNEILVAAVLNLAQSGLYFFRQCLAEVDRNGLFEDLDIKNVLIRKSIVLKVCKDCVLLFFLRASAGGQRVLGAGPFSPLARASAVFFAPYAAAAAPSAVTSSSPSMSLGPGP